MLDDRRRSRPLDSEAARTVGIEALGFLAADPALINRFLQLSGLEAHELRAAASDPAFFAGLLDFILADERTLHSFAETASLPPERVGQARRALAERYGDTPQ